MCTTSPDRLTLSFRRPAHGRRSVVPVALAATLAVAFLGGCGGGSDAVNSAAGGSTPSSQTSRAAPPATLSAARALLDLTTLPLPEGAEPSARATSAASAFRIAGAVEPNFNAQRQQLEGLGWTPVGDMQIYPQSASGVFGKDGYTLSLSVMPEGSGEKVAVQYLHHGNVDLSTLSPPAGVEVRFAQALSALWETAAAPDAAATALHDTLVAAGWEPYGEAGPMRYFRQNAVRLSVMTMAPASPGAKTSQHLGVELLSAQIPLPAAARHANFDIGTQTLRFQHDGPAEQVVQDYAAVLGGQGWKTSLDAITITDGKQVMAWRNTDNDLLTMEFAAPQAANANVLMTYQTAAQIAAMNKRLDEQAEAYLKAKKS